GSSGSLLLPLMVGPDPVMDARDGEGTRPLPPLPASIDGVFGRSSSARFTLRAAAGATYSFDLLGRRIGSRIDGAIRILDPSGKEIASIDDAPELGKEARLSFTASAAADYQVEV